MNEDQELEALKQLEDELKILEEAAKAEVEEPAAEPVPTAPAAPKKAKKAKEEKVEVKPPAPAAKPAPQKAAAVPTYAAERIRARLTR